jgi:hypothetical protein
MISNKEKLVKKYEGYILNLEISSKRGNFWNYGMNPNLVSVVKLV